MLLSMPLFALSGICIAASSGVMAFIMFLVGSSKLHRLWGCFCISVFLWGLGAYFIGTAAGPEQADLWWRIAHIGVAFIPTLFLHFTYAFLSLKRPRTLIIFYFISFAFSVLALFSNDLIANMRFVFGEFYYDSPPGVLYPLFTAFFFGTTIFSHFLLYQAYRDGTLSEATRLQRARIRYFFLGMLISFAGGSLSFLPVYGLDIYPITNFAVILYPIVIGYAILKLQLFDIRVAAAQGLTVLLWIFVGIRLALSTDTREAWINGTLLVAVIFLGIFLIRSVNKEIETRIRAQKLANDLEHANERLRELDKQKTEFVSIAAHQLRTPITAIKGYSSLILEGSYGKLTKKLAEPLQTIYDSSDRMADTIDDFLNVSRIELGRMEYHMEPFDLAHAVEQTVDTFQLTAKQKGLDLTYMTDECAHESHTVNADPAKIQHVINNLIDNAIKYTLKGSVAVRLSCDTVNHMAKVSVTDSGAGIPKEALSKLFEKFVRAKNANSVNVSGSGLGLYVAKQMIVAHQGRIWAESEGVGKGATFSFELPLMDGSATA
ncbi:MAG TPA: ATP-binding protein [Candidatus Paceibacterota bacterium]|nr:ATP-binding protein [Candidatus Paceibacterota bacterium]